MTWCHNVMQWILEPVRLRCSPKLWHVSIKKPLKIKMSLAQCWPDANANIVALLSSQVRRCADGKIDWQTEVRDQFWASRLICNCTYMPRHRVWTVKALFQCSQSQESLCNICLVVSFCLMSGLQGAQGFFLPANWENSCCSLSCYEFKCRLVAL